MLCLQFSLIMPLSIKKTKTIRSTTYFHSTLTLWSFISYAYGYSFNHSLIKHFNTNESWKTFMHLRSCFSNFYSFSVLTTVNIQVEYNICVQKIGVKKNRSSCIRLHAHTNSVALLFMHSYSILIGLLAH